MKLTTILVMMSWAAIAVTAHAQPNPAAACPLAAADISKSLQTPVEEGKLALEIPGAGMVTRDCRYKSKNFSVMVKTSRYTNPAAAQEATKMLAGKLRAIPNDPDGAVIQEGQGDATTPAVVYVRNGLVVELRVLGIYYKDLKSKEADLRDMQTKLATIKRIS